MIRFQEVLNRYFIFAVFLLFGAAVLAQQPPAQAPPQPATPASHGYTVFAGGTVIGREDVTVRTAGGALTITGKGRITGSQDIVIQRVEIRYRADGSPESYEIDAAVNGSNPIALATRFTATSASTIGVDSGRNIMQTDAVSPQTIVLPNVFFASYGALTRRLATAAPGQEYPAFISQGNLGSVRLINSATERVQVGASILNVRRYGIALNNARGVIPMSIYADETGALMRVSVPGQGVEIMRDDLAAATSRSVPHSNPTDQAVTIPATGFNLGATITVPGGKGAGATMPAVVLMAGTATNDRDAMIGGIPIFGQLAGALADAGFLVVRYDKRGFGQSGGRAESATLGDQAEDAIAVVRWLSTRKDVDRQRIALIGHNEGAWTAMLAATRERRIAAIVSIAAPSVTGTDRVIEQQQQLLERTNIPPGDHAAKIDLQNRINAAVKTGKGWEGLPADIRKQADTPWFQSFLAYDPAKVLADVRQPMLLLHGALDREVPVKHVDRLAELAQKGRSRAVAVVTVREVNHLLVQAITGDVSEYPALRDRKVSPEATRAIADWLSKTFAAIN